MKTVMERVNIPLQEARFEVIGPKNEFDLILQALNVEFHTNTEQTGVPVTL
jgi:hypothetical protein